MTLGSHQQTVGKSQAHFTPRAVLDRLGPFDLDPCAGNPRPWNCAKENWVAEGLDRPWFGRVWLNPPFDRYQVGKWVERLAHHGDGVLLVHARTETEWFRPIWKSAAAILFLAQRIKFCSSDGREQAANSGAPPVLAAFGQKNAAKLAEGFGGTLIRNWLVIPPQGA